RPGVAPVWPIISFVRLKERAINRHRALQLLARSFVGIEIERELRACVNDCGLIPLMCHERIGGGDLYEATRRVELFDLQYPRITSRLEGQRRKVLLECADRVVLVPNRATFFGDNRLELA